MLARKRAKRGKPAKPPLAAAPPAPRRAPSVRRSSVEDPLLDWIEDEPTDRWLLERVAEDMQRED